MLANNDKYLEDTKELRMKIEGSFLTLGARLKHIRDGEVWRNGTHTSFSDFLQDAKIADALASKLITIAEVFVFDMKIEPTLIASVGYSDAYQVAVLAKNKKQAVDLLEEGSVLTSSDFRKRLTELKTGKDMAECEHEWQEIHLRQCAKCRERQKMYPAEIELPLELAEEKI